MSRVRLRISVSLDGYVAGPNQTLKEPLGVGGEGLHEWVVALRAWREAHGMEGGVENVSSRVFAGELENIGATVMGRNMFGGHPGPWNADSPWTGWWGKKPPFHHPVFVVTHHAREPLVMDGGTTFTFVTDGIEAALAQAKAAANGKDVAIAGGGSICAQYLRAGLVDEMLLHVVPKLLGGGERLFDGAGNDLHGLTLVETIAAQDVVHLKLARA